MLTMTLTSCGNPDYGQDLGRPLPGVPKQTVRVRDVMEASAVCRAYIEEHYLGGGNWPMTAGVVCDETTGARLGRVSYNGRFWEGE